MANGYEVLQLVVGGPKVLRWQWTPSTHESATRRELRQRAWEPLVQLSLNVVGCGFVPQEPAHLPSRLVTLDYLEREARQAYEGSPEEARFRGAAESAAFDELFRRYLDDVQPFRQRWTHRLEAAAAGALPAPTGEEVSTAVLDLRASLWERQIELGRYTHAPAVIALAMRRLGSSAERMAEETQAAAAPARSGFWPALLADGATRQLSLAYGIPEITLTASTLSCEVRDGLWEASSELRKHAEDSPVLYYANPNELGVGHTLADLHDLSDHAEKVLKKAGPEAAALEAVGPDLFTLVYHHVGHIRRFNDKWFEQHQQEMAISGNSLGLGWTKLDDFETDLKALVEDLKQDVREFDRYCRLHGNSRYARAAPPKRSAVDALADKAFPIRRGSGTAQALTAAHAAADPRRADHAASAGLPQRRIAR